MNIPDNMQGIVILYFKCVAITGAVLGGFSFTQTKLRAIARDNQYNII